MNFLCSQCGACCRNVVGSGLPHDENGVCMNLNRKTNSCSIYETRPEQCRVDKMFDKHFKFKISKKEFYKQNTRACHILIDKEGLDSSFKIDVDEYEK
tara:strand:- start:183 stop:476 length:294 start_codon:yes stop_codon:yes gene_type:complete